MLSASVASNIKWSDRVKPEPREVELYPALLPFFASTSTSVKHESDLQSHLPNGPVAPKPEPIAQDLSKREAVILTGAYNPPPASQHSIYKNVTDVEYTPERALQEGLNMVRTVEDNLNMLVLGSKLRHDVWKREVENLKGQSSPTTLIAVCGATGAGKSSILNAVLDDNIVPTSGMRACTAVVTEIAFHKKRSINGHVAFLSEAEWRQELIVLLHDLVDEDGTIKRTTDLKSDAGVAWQKVHAVYPNIAVDQLVKMDAQQILDLDANVGTILGTTKEIVAKDSKTFGKEIAKYIDSKDQKRGDKSDKKDRKKDKKEKNPTNRVREAAGLSSAVRNRNPSTPVEEPALWPLIRQVSVRCPAKALSTGAVLVDLPGVADANAARNDIAKAYMKKANCIWILAPVTRAVDDKTARDLLGDAFKMQLLNGNYDDHSITFIASKCDDISCTEVIGALGLRGDPKLENIEERIDNFRRQISEQKKKIASEKSLQLLADDLKRLKERCADHKAHLQALKDGEAYVSKFADKFGVSLLPAPSKKRKNKRPGKKASRKRHRSAESNDDSDNSISIATDSDNDSESLADSDSDSDDSDDSDNSDISDSEADSAFEVASGLAVDEETEESMEAKIVSVRDAIKALRLKQKGAKSQKRESIDRISALQKQLAKVQKEKNAFCSLKRSDFSRDVLKEDFRSGLKDMDDAAAEERDPENFDPSKHIRDYNAIDLPVFTCSSRDYVRLKGQIKGDGGPSCFMNVDDTGIPALQKWCHQLTIASRDRAARGFLFHLETFAKSIQSYVQGIGNVTAEDRDSLREQWESKGFIEHAERNPWEEFGIHGPAADILNRIASGLDGSYQLDEPKRKLNEKGAPIGITPRLCMEFATLANKCVDDLKKYFKDGLEEKCRAGAAIASALAVSTVDDFAGGMHWATYRATLRRHGSWHRDLNVELITPFTRNIAYTWSTLFESNLFSAFEKETTDSITRLLRDFESSAASGLQDRARLQGEACLEEAGLALQSMVVSVNETMANQQKEISRCMAPHVQAELRDAYDRAMDERGKGSVARQQAYFRGYIDSNKDSIFEEGADVILDRLDAAATAVGEALERSLSNLAQKIEVNLAVLWEGVRDDPTQLRARKHIVEVVNEIQNQLRLWTEAAQIQKQQQRDQNDEDVEMATEL